MKLLSLISVVFLGAYSLAANNSNFESWKENQTRVSVDKIFQSMSFPDTARGVVVASPSKAHPDYYYHWVRDAGLVMDVVVDLYEKDNTPYKQSFIEAKINDFIQFSKQNQATQTLTGLGEPKFYVDGSSFGLSWGRPQTDGPALRALTLIRWAHIKLAQGEAAYVSSNLYNADFKSLIKADLEYVAQNWRRPSFDLWEEEKAEHFFTLMVQRAALIEGAQLAQGLSDFGASDWYLKQASAIENELTKFTNSGLPYIQVTRNHVEGLNTKKSGLDIAVILAVLRTPENQAFITLNHSMVRKTIDALISEFQKIYPINSVGSFGGVAIGRYPEDTYDGLGTSEANPWVLATMAIAEAYYKISYSKSQMGSLAEGQFYLDQGDQYFKRVMSHANPDYSLSEQIDRDTGHMVGASDLTWSYASVLKADWAREKAKESLLK